METPVNLPLLAAGDSFKVFEGLLTMNDKMLAQLKMALKYVDHLMVILFVVMVGVSYYLYSQERNFSLETLSTPGEIPWEDKVTAMTEDDKVKELFGDRQPDIRADRRSRRLVQVNMFDYSSVSEAQKVEEAVRDDFAQAQAAFDAGDFPRARQLAETILQRFENHLDSQRLIQKIEEAEAAKNAPPEPTPTPETLEQPAF